VLEKRRKLALHGDGNPRIGEKRGVKLKRRIRGIAEAARPVIVRHGQHRDNRRFP
jgi:hypothetical protein